MGQRGWDAHPTNLSVTVSRSNGLEVESHRMAPVGRDTEATGHRDDPDKEADDDAAVRPAARPRRAEAGPGALRILLQAHREDRRGAYLQLH